MSDPKATVQHPAHDTDIAELSTATTQHMPAIPPSTPPDRISNIEQDAGKRTLDEERELNDRRWRILAEQYAKLSAANASLAERAKKRDTWETAMMKMGARQNDALTILLSKGNSVRSEELRDVVILVVEDNEFLLPVMRTILSDAGATVYYERRAVDARLRLEKIGPEKLSCAVVDVRLPDGDGPGLAQDLRYRSPDCGIVLTSGFALDDYESLAERKRFAVLDKPFEPRALIDAVLVALHLRTA